MADLTQPRRGSLFTACSPWGNDPSSLAPTHLRAVPSSSSPCSWELPGCSQTACAAPSSWAPWHWSHPCCWPGPPLQQQSCAGTDQHAGTEGGTTARQLGEALQLIFPRALKEQSTLGALFPLRRSCSRAKAKHVPNAPGVCVRRQHTVVGRAEVAKSPSAEAEPAMLSCLGSGGADAAQLLPSLSASS